MCLYSSPVVHSSTWCHWRIISITIVWSAFIFNWFLYFDEMWNQSLLLSSFGLVKVFLDTLSWKDLFLINYLSVPLLQNATIEFIDIIVFSIWLNNLDFFDSTSVWYRVMLLFFGQLAFFYVFFYRCGFDFGEEFVVFSMFHLS